MFNRDNENHYQPSGSGVTHSLPKCRTDCNSPEGSGNRGFIKVTPTSHGISDSVAQSGRCLRIPLDANLLIGIIRDKMQKIGEKLKELSKI